MVEGIDYTHHKYYLTSEYATTQVIEQHSRCVGDLSHSGKATV
jgi:hypothetical protein